MLVVEHNLDVIKTADWIIDIGPEGGVGWWRSRGCGHAGTRWPLHSIPNRRAACQSPRSRTQAEPIAATSVSTKARKVQPPYLATEIRVHGAQQHNLKNVDATIRPRQDDRLLRPQRQRQKLAGDGHDLRRRPAAVRGKPQLLRPSVRQPTGKTARRTHRRPVASHCDRTEKSWFHAPQSPSARSPRSTTICGSCFHGWGPLTVPDCDIPSEPRPVIRSSTKSWYDRRHAADSARPHSTGCQSDLRSTVGGDSVAGIYPRSRRRLHV